MGEIKRFPFDAYPTGWFQVAYSREVAHGRVLGLHYFGRRLICYRGDSGNPYVLDAYCPHLGADNLCAVYEDRPQICRDYAADWLCERVAAPTLEERVRKYLQIFELACDSTS